MSSKSNRKSAVTTIREISLYVASDTCGLYLRGPFGPSPFGEDGTATAEFMKRNATEPDAKLGPSKPVEDGYYYLDCRLPSAAGSMG